MKQLTAVPILIALLVTIPAHAVEKASEQRLDEAKGGVHLTVLTIYIFINRYRLFG